jgi:ATP-dependent helicase/nuclease subunit A
MAQEHEAREREELNGLYVAMTRARRRLVFSATEPSRRNGPAPNWWQRVEASAAPWQPVAVEANSLGPEAPPRVDVLPRWKGGTKASPPGVTTTRTPASRLGQAVHRVLEWVGAGRPVAALERLCEAAAAEFGSSASDVARTAAAILHSPTGARFFAGPALRWAGNEVPLALGGEVLRVDRLVLLDEGRGPVWWVLDYKLQHRPQELAAYREQLARYRAAVQQAQPGAPVRSAFIAGDGSVIESD